MKKKITTIVLCVLPLALSFSANAQQARKVYRIGYLSNSVGIELREETFRQGLQKLGYVEGQNIVIDWRFTKGNGDLFPELVAELVRLKVDIIMEPGGQSIRAAQNATRTIPIVMMAVSDPVSLGFVDSLARPGGNIIGLTTQTPELGGKRLELLKEIIPKLSRVAVLGDRNSPGYGPQKKEIEIAAPALGLKLQIVEPGPNDLDNASRP